MELYKQFFDLLQQFFEIFTCFLELICQSSRLLLKSLNLFDFCENFRSQILQVAASQQKWEKLIVTIGNIEVVSVLEIV